MRVHRHDGDHFTDEERIAEEHNVDNEVMTRKTSEMIETHGDHR
jgi:hypothetical protein